MARTKTPLIALGLILGLAAAAPAAGALTVEANLSADFQKKLDKEYGKREAKVLTDILVKKIERTFAREGVKAERVVVTIEDAKPNRPTMKQVSDTPGLDGIHSVGIGGAELTGIAYDASGKELGKFNYDWYETDISNSIGVSTWYDARWSFDRFATRFADKLS